MLTHKRPCEHILHTLIICFHYEQTHPYRLDDMALYYKLSLNFNFMLL